MKKDVKKKVVKKVAKKPVKKTVANKVVKKKEATKKNSNLSQLGGKNEYVALAVVDAAKYQKTNIKLIKELVKGSIPGVYVTLNRPYQNLNKQFTKDVLKNIIFIDAVSKTVGGRIKKTKECLFIGSPQNLSDISIAMDQAIMAIQAKEKFLFFDSLSTLLLYNNVKVVVKFVHFLSGKMRTWGVKGIIISLRKKKDKELIDELKSFCDFTLDL